MGSEWGGRSGPELILGKRDKGFSTASDVIMRSSMLSPEDEGRAAENWATSRDVGLPSLGDGPGWRSPDPAEPRGTASPMAYALIFPSPLGRMTCLERRV